MPAVELEGQAEIVLPRAFAESLAAEHLQADRNGAAAFDDGLESKPVHVVRADCPAVSNAGCAAGLDAGHRGRVVIEQRLP